MSGPKIEVLRLENISKLHLSSDLFNINLNLFAGEIHGILIRNASFQNPLFDLFRGLIQHDSGSLYVDDIPYRFDTPRASMKAGIYTITRQSQLVSNMSIAENIFLVQGDKPLAQIIHNNRIESETNELLNYFELANHMRPNTRAQNFSPAMRHIVEILKAVQVKAKVIVVDNTIIQYSENEIKLFQNVLRKAAALGIAILFFISKYNDFLEVADRLTIVRNGTTAAHIDQKPFDSEQITTILAGNPIKNVQFTPAQISSENVIRVRGLCNGNDLCNINFDLLKGEVLGILDTSGFAGNSLADILFYHLPCSGEISIEGKTYKSASHIPKKYIGLIPEGEKLLFHNLSLYDNVTLITPKEIIHPLYATYTRINYYIFKETLNTIHSSFLIEKYGDLPKLPPLSKEDHMRILTAKWIYAGVKLLILINPGIRFDATNNNVLKQLIGDVCTTGVSVLVVSNNISELLNVCTRIIEIENGTILLDDSAEAFPKTI